MVAIETSIGPIEIDGQGFAAFGGVTSGMDIVRRIQAGPTNDREQLIAPVAIVRIYRK